MGVEVSDGMVPVVTSRRRNFELFILIFTGCGLEKFVVILSTRL